MPAQRYRDWLQQACWDLDHARAAVREGHFEWAAFAAEQAAGKALKALHIFLRGSVWSHDLPLLMESLLHGANVKGHRSFSITIHNVCLGRILGNVSDWTSTGRRPAPDGDAIRLLRPHR